MNKGNNMQIDEKLLQKLEKLSSLKIAETKREGTIQQLTEILAFVENLNELELADEEATFTTVKGGTPFREDEPSNNPEVIDTILKNAPQTENTSFVVPKIIE